MRRKCTSKKYHMGGGTFLSKPFVPRRGKWGGEGEEVEEGKAGRGREPFIVQHQLKYFCSDDRATRVVA